MIKTMISALKNKWTLAALTLVLFASFYLVTRDTQTSGENTLWFTDKHILLAADVNVPYLDYLEGVQKDCPYYQPDGATYRECLSALLKEQEMANDIFQNKLIADLQGKTDVTNLQKMADTWRSYRDTLCMSEFSANVTGSNYMGFVDMCRLYETERHWQVLQHIRYSWTNVLQ